MGGGGYREKSGAQLGRTFAGPSAGDIAGMLRPHAEALGRMIFPAAVLSGGFLCIGSLHGEAGDSLKIQTRGPKAGTWADYATSDSDPRGKGDMLKLLQLTIGGGDIKRGIEEAKRFLNLDSMDPQALERMQRRAAKAQAKAERDKASLDEQKRANAEGLWQGAAPLTPSSPAVLYLAGRGIRFGGDSPLPRPPGSIRFRPDVWHEEKRRKLPAMVTCYLGLDGQIKAVHITYLEFQAGAGWVKLPDMVIEGKPTKVAKKTRSPLYWGAYLPLWKGNQRGPLHRIKPGTAIYASEGIEDGLSYAMADPGARIVAAGTLGNLGQMMLPAQAGDLILLAQNDTKPDPIKAFEDAIKKQQAQAATQAADPASGRDGEIRGVLAKRPPQGIKDWNDWLRGGA